MKPHAGTEIMNAEVQTEIAPHSSQGETENLKNAEQPEDLSDNGDNLNVKCVDDGQSEQVNDQDEERQQLERDGTPCKQECHEFSVEPCNAQRRQDNPNNQSFGEELVEEVDSISMVTDEEEEYKREKCEQDHSEYYALKRESSVQLEEAVELKLFLIGILLGLT